ncbi:MAG TPA: ferredoxin family protein [Chlorobaculum sp.]|jgi:NAD-dependent dihydropyrimidine dehydrogenase PreA subunit|uniref:Ferredoxin, 4Fe-4S, putative n=1 Tax=Chlorobaculum tepidum (strain ATCC 49652 / DSM 12025 / NBRC 103806 / TLS) TaxID=194439 RepID=Q8KG02_CHLTE|nr:ferredoxin family protein [Chlorobaculum tepidum]AAM71416.1 ferredoxin, 4Fe-4S, putative [Chlorobaculum tepidum TLS]HBU23643.1 ferredoxin family protein [Chlorobaculum sp.]
MRKRLLAPREEIAWYPAIDADICNGCEACAEFCRPGVFAPGAPEPDAAVVKRPKMQVAHPMNCLVLCTRCVPVCPSGAITLPDPLDFERFVEYIE